MYCLFGQSTLELITFAIYVHIDIHCVKCSDWKFHWVESFTSIQSQEDIHMPYGAVSIIVISDGYLRRQHILVNTPKSDCTHWYPNISAQHAPSQHSPSNTVWGIQCTSLFLQWTLRTVRSMCCNSSCGSVRLPGPYSISCDWRKESTFLLTMHIFLHSLLVLYTIGWAC